MDGFEFERYEAHGWIIHRKMMAAGEFYDVEIPVGYDIAHAANISLWTSGHVLVTDRDSGAEVGERTAGDGLLARHSMRAGNYRCTATEPSEFWCINAVVNRRRMPQIELCDTQDGFALLHGDLLLCEGVLTIDGNLTVHAPAAIKRGNRTLTPVSRCLGFVFLD